jgi:acyl-CoA thioesterase FadM
VSGSEPAGEEAPVDRALAADAGWHVEHARVGWIDTDAGARIHFTVAFRWAEMAEVGLRRKLGLTGDWAHYPRRRVEADFLKVLVFDDEVEIALRPERVGRTSITYVWQVTCRGELCITGRHTCVRVDEHGRPTPLPEEIRAGLRPLVAT